MIRRLKVLGLALVALAAFGVSASAAQAAEETVTAGGSPATLTGAQVEKHVMTFTGGTWSCKTATLSGTMSTTSVTSLSLTPTYGECTFFGRAATLTVNNCADVLHDITGTVAKTDIACPSEKEITIDIPALGCVIHIEPQTNVGSVTLDNGTNAGTGKKDITATFNLTGIKYTETTGCLGTEIGKTHSNGTYKGTSTINATVAGVASALFAQ